MPSRGFHASDRKKWPWQYRTHYKPSDTIGCGLEVDAKKNFLYNGVRIGKGLLILANKASKN